MLHQWHTPQPPGPSDPRNVKPKTAAVNLPALVHALAWAYLPQLPITQKRVEDISPLEARQAANLLLTAGSVMMTQQTRDLLAGPVEGESQLIDYSVDCYSTPVRTFRRYDNPPRDLARGGGWRLRNATADTDPILGSGLDPAHNWGISTRDQVWICCQQPLQHPGCWSGIEKGLLVPMDFRANFDPWALAEQQRERELTADDFATHWRESFKKGTYWIPQDVYKRLEREVLALKEELADSIGVALFSAYHQRIQDEEFRGMSVASFLNPLELRGIETMLWKQITFNKPQCTSPPSFPSTAAAVDGNEDFATWLDTHLFLIAKGNASPFPESAGVEINKVFVPNLRPNLSNLEEFIQALQEADPDGDVTLAVKTTLVRLRDAKQRLEVRPKTVLPDLASVSVKSYLFYDLHRTAIEQAYAERDEFSTLSFAPLTKQIMMVLREQEPFQTVQTTLAELERQQNALELRVQGWIDRITRQQIPDRLRVLGGIASGDIDLVAIARLDDEDMVKIVWNQTLDARKDAHDQWTNIGRDPPPQFVAAYEELDNPNSSLRWDIEVYATLRAEGIRNLEPEETELQRRVEAERRKLEPPSRQVKEEVEEEKTRLRRKLDALGKGKGEEEEEQEEEETVQELHEELSEAQKLEFDKDVLDQFLLDMREQLAVEFQLEGEKLEAIRISIPEIRNQKQLEDLWKAARELETRLRNLSAIVSTPTQLAKTQMREQDHHLELRDALVHFEEYTLADDAFYTDSALMVISTVRQFVRDHKDEIPKSLIDHIERLDLDNKTGGFVRTYNDAVRWDVSRVNSRVIVFDNNQAYFDYWQALLRALVQIPQLGPPLPSVTQPPQIVSLENKRGAYWSIPQRNTDLTVLTGRKKSLVTRTSFQWIANSCWIDSTITALFKIPHTALELLIRDKELVITPGITAILSDGTRRPLGECTGEDVAAMYQFLMQDIHKIQSEGTVGMEFQCMSRQLWNRCVSAPIQPGKPSNSVNVIDNLKFMFDLSSNKDIVEFPLFNYHNTVTVESFFKQSKVKSRQTSPKYYIFSNANPVEDFDRKIPLKAKGYQLTGATVFVDHNHFVAYVRDPPTGKWWFFDSRPGGQTVRQVLWKDVQPVLEKQQYKKSVPSVLIYASADEYDRLRNLLRNVSDNPEAERYRRKAEALWQSIKARNDKLDKPVWKVITPEMEPKVQEMIELVDSENTYQRLVDIFQQRGARILMAYWEPKAENIPPEVPIEFRAGRIPKELWASVDSNTYDRQLRVLRVMWYSSVAIASAGIALAFADDKVMRNKAAQYILVKSPFEALAREVRSAHPAFPFNMTLEFPYKLMFDTENALESTRVMRFFPLQALPDRVRYVLALMEQHFGTTTESLNQLWNENAIFASAFLHAVDDTSHTADSRLRALFVLESALKPLQGVTQFDDSAFDPLTGQPRSVDAWTRIFDGNKKLARAFFEEDPQKWNTIKDTITATKAIMFGPELDERQLFFTQMTSPIGETDEQKLALIRYAMTGQLQPTFSIEGLGGMKVDEDMLELMWTESSSESK